MRSQPCATFQPPAARATARCLERVVGLIGSLPTRMTACGWKQLLRARLAVRTSRWRDALPGSTARPRQAGRGPAVGGGQPHPASARQGSGTQAARQRGLLQLADGSGSHPARRAAGYPGPLPPPVPPRDGRLPTAEVMEDVTLDCDVVICGSGAGGGVAAGCWPSRPQRDRLEKGENLGPAEFTRSRRHAVGGLHAGGLLMTQSGSLPILAGSTVSAAGRSSTGRRACPCARRRVSNGTACRGCRSSPVAASRNRSRASRRVPGQHRQLGPRRARSGLERGLRACGWHVDVIRATRPAVPTASVRLLRLRLPAGRQNDHELSPTPSRQARGSSFAATSSVCSAKAVEPSV